MNFAEPAISALSNISWESSGGDTPTISLSDAFAHCQALAASHYENFPVASLVLPKKLRPYVAAVYAFARIADDFADEAAFAEVRMARLKEWEGLLKDMEENPPSHPVFIALKETIQRFQIPILYFSDLLTAFKMDVITTRYATFTQVLNYCRYSANPVGRIVLHIMGYPVPRFMEYSDAICTALQLANFWQDVEVDLAKNRVYLPEEDMGRFGVSIADLRSGKNSDAFKRLMRFQIERAYELFEKGKPLCTKVPGRFGFELRLTWLGGTTILKKLGRQNGAVFGCRPVLTKWDALGFVLKAFRKSFFEQPIF